MKKRKKYKKNYKLNINLIVFIIILLIGILFALRTYKLWNINFSKLDIPQVKIENFSNSALVIQPFSKSILGAQIFDAFDVVDEVNKERLKVGANPLRVNLLLSNAAQKRLDVILKYQNFSHYDPNENIQLDTVMPMVGYKYSYASENIGMGGSSGADFVFGFMHSQLHKENLLNPALVDTGVAVGSGPYQKWYVNIVVQLFAIPGSVNEYLGYSKIDKENYRQILFDINSKLNPLDWTIGNILNPKNYNSTIKNQLENQKQLLTKVYSKMEKNEPLTNEDIKNIEEYNKLISPEKV